jgi:hypothetical protein
VTLDFRSFWTDAIPWSAFVRPEMKQYELWKGVADHVVIPGWAMEKAMRGPLRRLLVLAADWCGDAANTVPVMARLAELVPGMELRILERDEYPQVMNRYLTDGTRSIPLAIALDTEFRELGHWGPRPAVLQDWVLGHRKLMPTPQRYAYARGWYARDKGESTLRELLDRLDG